MPMPVLISLCFYLGYILVCNYGWCKFLPAEMPNTIILCTAQLQSTCNTQSLQIQEVYTWPHSNCTMPSQQTWLVVTSCLGTCLTTEHNGLSLSVSISPPPPPASLSLSLSFSFSSGRQWRALHNCVYSHTVARALIFSLLYFVYMWAPPVTDCV